MGQEQSVEQPEVSMDRLSFRIANKFADKCFSQLELYHFQNVFNSLAENRSGIIFWSESTLCRFLELPDELEAGAVIFQMASFLGAFPFPSQAPCILTYEALLKVVTLTTKRHRKVLKRAEEQRIRLYYSSLAIHDNNIGKDEEHFEEEDDTSKGGIGFAIDQPLNEDTKPTEDDEDELALTALDALDEIEAIGFVATSNISHSIIPKDNLIRLIRLLIVIAPATSRESVTPSVEYLNDAVFSERLTRCTKSVVNAFSQSDSTLITYRNFSRTIVSCFKNIFSGFDPLFERFMFDKGSDLSKRKYQEPGSSPSGRLNDSTFFDRSIQHTRAVSEDFSRSKTSERLSKPFKEGEILTVPIMSQLSFFLDPYTIFGRLHHLYSGSEHGFSLHSFSSQVFTWKAPTILLVSGTILRKSTHATQDRDHRLVERLQHRNLQSSVDHLRQDSCDVLNQVTYGAYIPMAWTQTPKEPFRNPSTLLFQLEPVHDVFKASKVNQAHLAFDNRPNFGVSGIALGSALPLLSTKRIVPGSVSLHLDDSLEIGTFTHLSSGGGSFLPSTLPDRRNLDWQDHFEVEAIEVCGIGGNAEKIDRHRRINSEQLEAKIRREGRSSISGDSGVNADREILKMAGLIGHGESGGSMG